MSVRSRGGGVWCLAGSLLLAGCSAREYAASKVGDTLASGGAGWSSDEDPELVRESLPFALKLMESLAAEAPRHSGLRLGLCRGFASYAAGFLEPDAEAIEPTDFERAKAIRERARKLHLRARGWCLQALELGPRGGTGAGAKLLAGDPGLLAAFTPPDVELLYWTGVSWGSAVALGLDRPEMVADLPAVRAIFERALALDEEYDRGSLHEAMIAFDSMPPMMGGSLERARFHFDRAVDLAGGRRAGPFVTWARSATIPRQARTEFEDALGRALAVDVDAEPADRMVNLIAQERARRMLARVEDFFFAAEEEKGSE
jgi:predicted anti-sigma-YlaC factor YlaD